MRTLRVTPKAERDLLAIARYSEEAWSVHQRDRYLKTLTDRFLWLCDNHELGKVRDDINPDYWAYHEGKHMIFYLVSDAYIDIIGVLHERMDYQAHL